MQSLTKEFLLSLTAFDKTLDGVFDQDQDSVHIFSNRGGEKELVLSLKRDYAEGYEACSRRALARLHEMDIWRKYGDGKSYDKYLDEKEKDHRVKKKKEYKEKRERLFKEHATEIRHAIKNAQSGKFAEGSGLHQDKKFY